jgi:hypothetical protein
MHELVQAMRDINDGDSAGFQLLDNLEENLGLSGAERRRRFIEDEDPGFVRKRTS